MRTEEIIQQEIDIIEDSVFSGQIDNIRDFLTESLESKIREYTIEEKKLLELLDNSKKQTLEIEYHYPIQEYAIIIPVGEIEAETSSIDTDCIDDWYVSDTNPDYAYYPVIAVAIEIDKQMLVSNLKEYAKK